MKISSHGALTELTEFLLEDLKSEQMSFGAASKIRGYLLSVLSFAENEESKEDAAALEIQQGAT